MKRMKGFMIALGIIIAMSFGLYSEFKIPWRLPLEDNLLSIEKNKIMEPSRERPRGYIQKEGKTIEERFPTPNGYERITLKDDSYGEYLRNYPLKPHGTEVRYFDGRLKGNKSIAAAILNIDVGKRDLQQCADAAIRLRAEYLFKQGRYEEICFKFTSGFSAEYSRWMDGYRISIDGNDVEWIKKREPNNTYESFRKYLDLIFTYAGTLSLERDLMAVEIEDIEIGDIIIQGGSPGHAVIIVDMVVNKITNEKLFLLAQSYMPAQDIHILNNPTNSMISPWYSIKEKNLHTPEWVFEQVAIKRFQ